MVQLEGTIQQQPAPGARSDDDLALDVLQASGQDCERARGDLVAAVPDGWRLIALRRL